ncbi:MAG: MCT family MFS transporter [Dehalococcoidia bacterium]
MQVGGADWYSPGCRKLLLSAPALNAGRRPASDGKLMAGGATSDPARLQREPIFFGWYVVGCAFLVMFVGFGVNYSFAVFFDPLKQTFGATKTQISGLFAVTGFLYFSFGLASGRLSDRVGPRPLVLTGGLLIAAGLFAASRANQLWQVYAGYCIGVGLGVGCMYVPAISAVQQWFLRRRGLATGIAVAGIGVGNLAGPPIGNLLIHNFGWRAAYAILGVTVLVLVVVALWRMENSPAKRGLGIDGAAGAAPASGGRSTPSTETSSVYHTRVFWLLYLSCLFTSLALFIPFVHLSSYAKNEGISASGAAWIVGLIGAGSAGGRLFLGSAADRLGRRRSLIGTYAVMGVMLLWWLLSHSAWQLAIFSVGFGLGYGGFVALLPALAADYFGAARAGAIIGGLYTSAGIGNLIGPTLAGKVYDATGAYTIAIVAGIVVNVLAVACIVLLDEPARHHARAVPVALAAE